MGGRSNKAMLNLEADVSSLKAKIDPVDFGSLGLTAEQATLLENTAKIGQKAYASDTIQFDTAVIHDNPCNESVRYYVAEFTPTHEGVHRIKIHCRNTANWYNRISIYDTKQGSWVVNNANLQAKNVYTWMPYDFNMEAGVRYLIALGSDSTNASYKVQADQFQVCYDVVGATSDYGLAMTGQV